MTTPSINIRQRANILSLSGFTSRAYVPETVTVRHDGAEQTYSRMEVGFNGDQVWADYRCDSIRAVPEADKVPHQYNWSVTPGEAGRAYVPSVFGDATPDIEVHTMNPPYRVARIVSEDDVHFYNGLHYLSDASGNRTTMDQENAHDFKTATPAVEAALEAGKVFGGEWVVV